MFNDRLEVHNNTMVKIQHTWHIHITMGARRGGGDARIGVRPPPLGKSNTFFLLYGWPFSYFFSVGWPFCYVLLFIGGPFHHVRAFLLPFSPCRGIFCYVFLLMGGLFHHVRAFLLPFSPMWGAFFALLGAFYGRASMHITYIIILSC